MLHNGIVVLGGVGSPSSVRDGCRRAAEAGQAVLQKGGSAMEAVIEAATVLEDDGRYNAGSGASLRLDGKTIEMDAAVMDSEGKIGGVAGISRVKNPIQVAREVISTPHVLLCGQGAVEFARRRGFTDFYEPSDRAVQRYERVVKLIREDRRAGLREAWRDFDLESDWNFDVSYGEAFACDTIGAVALDEKGLLAVANSTGGAGPMLLGRVGDSPLIGCGFYAGPCASVATTGIGEEIIRKMLARQVYDWIRQGEDVAKACERGVALYPDDVPIGVIALARRGAATAHNRDMAAWEIVTRAP